MILFACLMQVQDKTVSQEMEQKAAVIEGFRFSTLSKPGGPLGKGRRRRRLGELRKAPGCHVLFVLHHSSALADMLFFCMCPKMFMPISFP